MSSGQHGQFSATVLWRQSQTRLCKPTLPINPLLNAASYELLQCSRPPQILGSAVLVTSHNTATHEMFTLCRPPKIPGSAVLVTSHNTPASSRSRRMRTSMRWELQVRSNLTRTTYLANHQLRLIR